jgi:NDP-sugar pyrophosphorylase family protein
MAPIDNARRKTMKTLIHADDTGTELNPLSERTCKPLLPVAGKPLIGHTLELLYRAGIREATVLAGTNSAALNEGLEGGAPWGMQLEILPRTGLMDGGDSAMADDDGVLLVRGDMLIDLDLGALLEKAARLETGAAVRTGRGTIMALLIRCRGKQASERPEGLQVALADTACNTLDSLQAYHRANMDVMRGVCRHLSPAGIELSYGIWSEPGATLSRNSVRGGNVFIGAASHADEGAEFAGDVVVGERVLIDRKAKLANTVILPNTYVGAYTDIRNTIVWGDLLIRVDIGVITKISDKHILADISPPVRDSRHRPGRKKRLLSAWKTSG